MNRRNLMTSAAHDWGAALRRAPVWWHLSLMDVRLKYRRTLLGPLWITAGTGMMVLSLGLVFSRLFGQDPTSFLPYLASGVIAWNFIANTLGDGCLAFVGEGETYKSVALPYSYAVMRVVARNWWIFLHNGLILIAVALAFDLHWLVGLPELIAGVALVSVNLVWATILLAMATARFRDVQQFVGIGLNIAFLITPVFWDKAGMAGAEWIYQWNIFSYMVDAIREPVLRGHLPDGPLAVLSLTAAGGLCVSFLIFSRLRPRIVYWL